MARKRLQLLVLRARQERHLRQEEAQGGERAWRAGKTAYGGCRRHAHRVRRLIARRAHQHRGGGAAAGGGVSKRDGGAAGRPHRDGRRGKQGAVHAGQEGAAAAEQPVGAQRGVQRGVRQDEQVAAARGSAQKVHGSSGRARLRCNGGGGAWASHRQRAPNVA